MRTIHTPASLRPFVRSMLKLMNIRHLLFIVTLVCVAVWLSGLGIKLFRPAKAAIFAIRFVSTSGTDALDCIGSPCATINYAVSQAIAGDTISVAAGTYTQNPIINKSVTLTGANAGIAGSGVRGAESIIRTSGAAQTAVFSVTASNVTINGFTIDGDDPGQAGIPLQSGDNANASYGVRPTGAISNLTVSNNIIKKVEIGLRGDSAGQGHVITQNWFDSIGHFDFGYAVSIRNNFYANVTNNKMTKAWTGVHINNHNGPGGPASFLITGNEIHSYAGGILYWLQYNQATGATISGNMITAETGAVANNFGVLMVSIQDMLNPSFTNNTITGHDYGIGLTNTSTSNSITVGSTNAITGTKVAGVYLTDNLTFNPVGTTDLTTNAYTGAANAIAVNLNGVPISAASGVGVKVETSRTMAADVTTTANIMGGTSISGGTTGLLVTGAATALSGNTLNNTSFSGQSGDYITLANTALDNLTINATAVTFNGLTGATATTAQNFAIEDKLKHAIDDPSLGFILVKTGAVFTTVNSFNAPNTTTPSIQRAVDLANSSETVNVGAGTFIEDVVVTKTLIVCGTGPASTIVSGPIGGPGSTFALTASNIELKGFKITREGNNVTDWNNGGTNTAGVSIAGASLTGINVHDNLVIQNRTGIDINNSSGNTVRNNIVTDNNTGMIFRNVTDNETVVENEITLNRTVGIVFLNANTEPAQSALNCTFSNNNLSGNWYAQIVDRQLGTTNGNPIPTPGTTNLKNFSGNWFGTNMPVITTMNSAEPGYATHIPVEFGGTATPPGGQPDIAGPASANFDYTPYLDVGTDTNVETTLGRGTYGFQGSFNVLDVIASNAQTGATGRIQEGVNLVNIGGTVKALNGTYTENANVNKAATLAGTPTINGTLAASVAGATISPGFSPGIIPSGNLTLTSGSVISIELASAAGPGTGHDQLDVTGTVSLGNATLNATSSFAPSIGTSFVIINNDLAEAVTGTFNGLPNGATFVVGSTLLQINYASGTNNNDVVLTAVNFNTTTTVTSSPNPSTFGQPVTFTATVATNPASSTTPTGSVTFIIDGVPAGTVGLNGAGQASLATSSLTPAGSPHSVTAVYSPNAGFNTSTGTLAGGQTVNKANTTTAITSDNPDPSALGQVVTIAYNVTVGSPGAGTPTGNVTVTATTGESCIGTVAAGSCTITFTTPGTRTLTANYAGDANFNGSASPGASHQVLNGLTLGGGLADPLVCTGPGNVLNVTATVTNTNAITVSVDFSATPTVAGQLLVIGGSCTATGQLSGTCSTTGNTQVSFSGQVAAGQTVTFTYRVQVADNVPTGTSVCMTSISSLNSGPAQTIQACATVNCPAVGPGSLFPSTAEVSDQKAGSVLVYNLYSSSIAAPNQQNTRVSITNTNPGLSIAVHLFFVDGATCSIADSLVCLTPNQTASFLASDIDPGTTGYIVAVASDLVTGCPVDFNYLIGDEYVKLSSGHAANLAAESFAALAGGLPACNGLSVTALLSFDGTSYNRAPRVLAASNIPSRADGNDTLIVLNRFGGSLAAGAGTLGSLFGIFYDDAENPLSFTFTAGVCQFRSSLSSNFPRTAPRFEQFIPAGRSGWAKFYSQSDVGLLGAQINFNANAGTAANAFNQGHNLHKLTLTTAATLTIPIFPPNC